MAEADKPGYGTIGWLDITVPEAGKLCEFYAQVAGWRVEPIDMGGYQDFCMLGAGGSAVAGICHSRGANRDLPPVWLPYITVPDLDASLARCAETGGAVQSPPRSAGAYGRIAVIRDPAGAFVALLEPPAPPAPSGD
jgi:uncharacterized protein